MIHIFLRHCMNSEVSKHKHRPKEFNRETLFEKILHSLTLTQDSVELIVFLDTFNDKEMSKGEKHFTQESTRVFKIVQKECGSEASAFLNLLHHVKEQSYHKDDIIIFLEDDYLVGDTWIDVVKEGLYFAEYVTLYDHPDKYSSLYANLTSVLFKGSKKHWRTTPSTTNSYAMKFSTLLRDFVIHEEYSRGVKVTRDHEKFLALWKTSSLVSCIPGEWSHEEMGMQTLILRHSDKKQIFEQDQKPMMTYFS